jgi:glycerophosphoryl diester phosphodiesterase
VAALFASLVLLTVAAPGAASAAPKPPPNPDTGANPWLQRRFLNMAHAGGENEAPAETMYAFKRAVALGADMIELDVESTVDDQLVVIHNATVDQTTNGTGLVRDLTFDQVHALDGAYNFVPGRSAVPGLPPESYPLRGVRTGDRRPPAGYKPKDFAVPSLREVLRTFPDVPLNIEIKGTADEDTESFLHNARLLAKLLNKTGRTDIIVTSFNDPAVALFHQLAPQIPLAPGLAGLTAYFLAGVRPIEGTVALQVPVQFSGVPVATREFVARAHADGYAVHVWFSGSAPDDAPTYNAIIDTCADGMMPAYPALLEQILDQRHIARPGMPGIDPCQVAPSAEVGAMRAARIAG